MHTHPQPSDQENRTVAAYDTPTARQYLETFGDLIFVRSDAEAFRTLLPSGSVLDIGCGPGHHSQLFAPPSYAYTGVDASEAMITLAQTSFPDRDFRLANIYTWPFAKKTFDGFWACLSLHHLHARNILWVLQNIRQILRPNGVGYIRMKEGHGESIAPVQVGQPRINALYTREQFTAILLESGFTIRSQGTDSRHVSTGGTFLTYFVQRIA